MMCQLWGKAEQGWRDLLAAVAIHTARFCAVWLCYCCRQTLQVASMRGYLALTAGLFGFSSIIDMLEEYGVRMWDPH